ncbi:hypothetical protein PUNSTDRAFT_137438 [Punctularia strigosozonata HHB-11173 SS5]|uniref:uncharacterized protein n=1 Tax=Punctularia strigosozonata (strain HHB-11173) TaxID=741275 RepID=UPI00044175D8|nr:uncharacterized protein PUNSTDRAFT_137438 [Punctularia strigosozonata HHB-11173 SS5]EIN05325.1 hypothetical protein PUNSTDRAFT_137438 [Punctularia strigosozonata HHB-11173 SS5]
MPRRKYTVSAAARIVNTTDDLCGTIAALPDDVDPTRISERFNVGETEDALHHQALLAYSSPTASSRDLGQN